MDSSRKFEIILKKRSVFHLARVHRVLSYHISKVPHFFGLHMQIFIS